MNTPSITIAIPVYNEHGSIQAVVKRAQESLRKITPRYEILLVDDGSTDGTGKLVNALAKRFKNIRVIHHTHNQGFSGAIKSCYKNATQDLVFLMPGDGQVDSKDIQRFLGKLPNADVVVGFRIHSPEPFMRKVNSWGFHMLYRILFGVPLKEISTSVLWRRKLIQSLPMTSHPRSAMIEPEVIYRAHKKGARMTQVGIPYYPRSKGKAKGGNILMILVTLKGMFTLWWKLRIRGKN